MSVQQTMKPAKRSHGSTELVKWFEVVTQHIASQDPSAFDTVDLYLAMEQMDRMQFMVENGLGPSDMKDLDTSP